MADSKASRLERRAQKKEERAGVIAMQREQFHKRERNKKILNYSILVLIVAAAAYGIYAATRERASEHDALAQCLTEQGTIMYGTDWCPHCQAQKRLFGDSFRYVTFINCDYNAAACTAAGVEGYPTWTFARGPPAAGEQTLETLATRSECPLS
jgi:hypothetical protein